MLNYYIVNAFKNVENSNTDSQISCFCNDYYGTNYRNVAIIKPQQCYRSTCTLERANDVNAKNASAVSYHVATQT